MSNTYSPSPFYPNQPGPVPGWQPPHPPPVPPRRRSPLKVAFACLALSMAALCSLLALGVAFFTFFLPANHPVINETIPTPRPTLPPLKIYSVTSKQPTIDAQFIN